MVAGLEDITRGELYIDGQLMNDVAPKDRDIAMVFQNYALYPHMSVRQNMEFPLKLRKMSKEMIDKKVNEAAEILGITQYLNRKPKALSGGQRQRVAIGRAIVREPRVLLMDEPLSNLDAKLRNQMRAEIIKLRQRINTTFIYVTHDQTEAMTLGTRIVVMKDGVIQQTDTPQNLYQKPANLFVAGFIGSPQMNFVDAVISKEGSDVIATVGDSKLYVPAEKAKALEEGGYVGKTVVLGIRPEHIFDPSRAKVEGIDTRNQISSVIRVYELLGAEVFLYFDYADTQMTARVDPKTTAKTGDKFDFVLDMSMAHFFDKETEKTITN
jgi:multiple sugar transport system ATP-binding protein